MNETSAKSPARGGEWTGHALLIGVQFCFGFFHPISKWALEGFTPEALASWRIMAATAVLVPFAYWRHRADFWPRRADLWRLQGCALLGITINQLLYLEGVSRATSGNTGLIMALIPVFTVLLAGLFRQERWSTRRLLGIALALACATPLLLGKGASLHPEHRLGNLLLVCNALSYSCYLVFSRPLSQRMPPLVVIAWVFLLCTWTIPFFAWDQSLWPEQLSERSAWAFAYVLIFPTTLAYLMHIWALARVSASTTAVYILLQPLIAAQCGIAWLGERWTPELLLAQVGVITGIVVVSVPVQKHWRSWRARSS